MPRTTKEKAKKDNIEEEPRKAVAKKAPVKKNTTKKSAENKPKKTSSKKLVTKKESVSKEKPKASTKKNAEKKVTRKTVEKKEVTKKDSPKANTTKKATPKSNLSANKKATSKATKTSKKREMIAEYYDLPYKYNQTVVKLLAQTPKKLFVYWEISDEDIENYTNQFGEYFFHDTKPVLIIHNLTMNYSFEIDINDFANCWYIDINDADCLYDIELGRRPITFNEKIQTPYIYISSSNNLQAPNNHILFENIKSDTVLDFKNVKTKNITKKAIRNLSFFKNASIIYGNNEFYEFYKKLYGENLLEELAKTKLNNPSSGAISSFK